MIAQRFSSVLLAMAADFKFERVWLLLIAGGC
jgi:hypothetical protein